MPALVLVAVDCKSRNYSCRTNHVILRAVLGNESVRRNMEVHGVLTLLLREQPQEVLRL